MSTRNTQSNQELTRRILERAVEEIIERPSLEQRLASGKKLRVKFGIDPTSPDIHLGHTIPLWKVRHFQDLGHTGVIIIGDCTASIGDPSGRDKTRAPLTSAQIKKNSATYKAQVLKILRKERTEFHLQSEWFGKFRLADAIRLAARASVSQLLAHDTFRTRLERDLPFMAHEMLYPLLQAYDSLAVRADVEIGAVEQKFNILMGRTLQKQDGLIPQDVVLTPYLFGTDGKEKMSKSLGNYVSVQAPPGDMYGKLMSVSDELIVPYMELLTDTNMDEIEEIKQRVISDPRGAKVAMASRITALYGGAKQAKEAAREFEKVFAKGAMPSDIPAAHLPAKPIVPTELLVRLGLASSKSEARRLIEQGGVYIQEKRLDDWQNPLVPQKGTIVRVGKRRAVKIE